ncbi:hypothetical protein J7K27_06315 [Candidatus Bathyarchaeota archaeon]|nr:hypothetical protein [Candidatus Bathyarchaeota archaeon]
MIDAYQLKTSKWLLLKLAITLTITLMFQVTAIPTNWFEGAKITGTIIPSNEPIILSQDFDEEPTGSVPQGWTVENPEVCSLTVNETVYYGNSGKSAYVRADYCYIGRTFAIQTGSVIVEFAMRAEVPNYLMFYIDDGIVPYTNPNGANIYFMPNGSFAYYDDTGWHYFRSFSLHTWYRIKMVIDIQANTYDIYIDGSLEVEAAHFRGYGTVTQLSRMHFGATSAQPVGFIDEITVRLPVHDVAVTDVSPTSTVVPRGANLNINVTVKNEGDFTETFNVTVYSNDTAIILPNRKNYVTVTLTSEKSTNIIFIWNTTGFPLGNYTISAYVNPVLNETDIVDNFYINGIVQIVIQDIAITDITFSEQNPAINETIYIFVTVENRGNLTETFDIGLNYTRIIDPLIGTQTITLAPGESVTLKFTWTPITSGRYEIKAYTSPIPNDINPSDNTKTSCLYVTSGRSGGWCGGRLWVICMR